MAQTRAQKAANNSRGHSGMNGTSKAKSAAQKTSTIEEGRDQTGSASKRRHRENEKTPHAKRVKKEEAKSVHPTPSAQGKEKPEPSGDHSPILGSLISTYGILPLQELGLSESTTSKPEKVLALVLNAMLTSARISHRIARETVKCLIKANYHRIEALEASTWEERTRILTNGGYTHYREKTATMLGDLAKLVRDKYGKFLQPSFWIFHADFQSTAHSTAWQKRVYVNEFSFIDGDLDNLLKEAHSSPQKIRNLLKEVKGLGDVGIGIFFGTAQSVWPCLAPFIDSRNLETAKKIGLVADTNSLWLEVGKDSTKMCKLSSALTTVRMEKKEHEFR